MISSVRGDVQHVALDHAVVEVSGFGLMVLATPQTLSGLQVGEPAFLQTSFVPRQDDAPLLFGFADAQEREIFVTLLGISGIGPRLALAVLSVHPPDDVRRAIQDSDTAAFTKVPGIGKKTAQRIVLELAGKLVIEPVTAAPAASAAPAPSPAELAQSEVRAALGSLGWTEKDAAAAVQSALTSEPELAHAETAVLLRAVLRGLGAAKAGAAG